MKRCDRGCNGASSWLMVLSLIGSATTCASDLHVDPVSGDDQRDDVSQPVKTIARAVRLARPEGTIHLRPVTYRDWAAFFD